MLREAPRSQYDDGRFFDFQMQFRVISASSGQLIGLRR